MSRNQLLSSIIESPIWQRDHHVRSVWVALLDMADRRGVVSATLPELAHRARATVPETLDALRIFLAPDPYDRVLLQELDGGWLLLEHEAHRKIVLAELTKQSKRDWYHRNKGKTANDSEASGG